MKVAAWERRSEIDGAGPFAGLAIYEREPQKLPRIVNKKTLGTFSVEGNRYTVVKIE